MLGQSCFQKTQNIMWGSSTLIFITTTFVTVYQMETWMSVTYPPPKTSWTCWWSSSLKSRIKDTASHFTFAILRCPSQPGGVLWIKASVAPKTATPRATLFGAKFELFLIILLPIMFHGHFPPRTIFTLHLIRAGRAVCHTSVNSHYMLAEVCPPFLFPLH